MQFSFYEATFDLGYDISQRPYYELEEMQKSLEVMVENMLFKGSIFYMGFELRFKWKLSSKCYDQCLAIPIFKSKFSIEFMKFPEKSYFMFYIS